VDANDPRCRVRLAHADGCRVTVMIARLGRYFWKLFLVNAALMAVVLAGCVWVIMWQFDRFHEIELSRYLFAQATTLEIAVQDRFDHEHVNELNALAEKIGTRELDDIRVTFVFADGTVAGDSVADRAKMDWHGDRPEIISALKTGFGESIRWSHTVTKNMKYIAVRVGSADNPVGVVRISKAVSHIAAQTRPAQQLVVTLVFTSVFAAILLALALALLWSRRIRRITESAQSISRGDLSARIEVFGHDEVALLGRSLNEMRERLSAQLETIDRHRRTLDSLVSQLQEGVVVADADGRIVLINSEAIKLLQLSTREASDSFIGQTVEQCIPQHRLQNLMRRTSLDMPADTHDLSGQSATGSDDHHETQTQEIEVKLSTGTGVRSVLARAFDIRLPNVSGDDPSSATNVHVGRTLVLTDVTELTRVMQVKADLAANASHELRTPLSAIRVAVETLRSVDWLSDVMAASRFIDVVDRHSGRMEAMIGDLLDLSRLESSTNRFNATPIVVTKFLEELHTTFADALAEKNLHWKTSVFSEGATFTASPELLRIILRNLIDNAIRFSELEGDIVLSVQKDDSTIVVEVADTGCGIALDQQHRVFERFYQVERARTGSVRGTGLGLSIVRHATTAMNAHIELQSVLGQGTRFTIRIPIQA